MKRAKRAKPSFFFPLLKPVPHATASEDALRFPAPRGAAEIVTGGADAYRSLTPMPGIGAVHRRRASGMAPWRGPPHDALHDALHDEISKNAAKTQQKYSKI